MSEDECPRSAGRSPGRIGLPGAVGEAGDERIVMGKSFFWGKDSELYISSNVFATLIAATPTTYGLTASQATQYGTLNTSWRTAYEVANTPATRTKAAITAKDTVRDQLRLMASNLTKIIEGTPTVTDTQKVALGI